MNTAPMIKKYRETLIPGIISMLLMSGLLALLIITGYLFAANTDDRIATAARKSYIFQTYLKGDDIQIRSEDGAVTLLGTVAEKPHLSLAADTVADLPGVKRVDNRLAVRPLAPGDARGRRGQPHRPTIWPAKDLEVVTMLFTDKQP